MSNLRDTDAVGTGECVSIDIRRYAKRAYNGYCEYSQNKSLISGQTLPMWENLPDTIQRAWEYATFSALDLYALDRWEESL